MIDYQSGLYIKLDVIFALTIFQLLLFSKLKHQKSQNMKIL